MMALSEILEILSLVVKGIDFEHLFGSFDWLMVLVSKIIALFAA